ncbi:phage terminase large subunit [Mesorhizobium sp. KR9-304]|uniref:phage terminase large subunit n=1 Tax=Mesorhizobium sp. KR9-304 TaxID=3156614 RepID=UPI0032B4002A
MTKRTKAQFSLPPKREILDAALRTNLGSFAAKCFGEISGGKAFDPNWHVWAIGYQLEQVLEGKTKRLLITMPPRSLKSLCASVALPAFALGKDPTKRIVCVSYAEDLAAKFARDCRAVMESQWYRRVFPDTRISPSRSASLDFETTRRGGRLSTSVGGTLTGRGGSLIVIDDAHKPDEAQSERRRATTLDWYSNTLASRLDDRQNDAIVLVMQRVHVDDLAGHLMEQGGWIHLNLPAIAIEDERVELGGGNHHHRRIGEPLHAAREPLEALERLKAEMGTFHFSAQFQQSPIPAEGNLIRPSWFGRYAALPLSETKRFVVQSWDLAVKDEETNDFSVCITAFIDGNQVFVTDVFRQRLNYPAQRRAVVDLARQHAANVILIEASANGDPLVADLRELNRPGIPTPIAIRPRGGKVERLSIQSHRIEAGDVRLPEKADWLEAFMAEMQAFPYGRYDDQVDALSQMLAGNNRSGPRVSFAGPITIGPF